MFHGLIEANSPGRAAESRLVRNRDDAAARHDCQQRCAKVASGARTGLCRRPNQPINAQHRCNCP
jgi:hypothetical protein